MTLPVLTNIVLALSLSVQPCRCLNFRYDLWRICVETPLGVSSAVSPEEQKELASLEKPEKKPNLQKALNPKTNHEAPVNDTGVTPGDCKGKSGHLRLTYSTESKRSLTFDQVPLAWTPTCSRI